MIKTQNTIAHEISCSGIGLHSGEQVHIRLLPAPENSGITFRRTDIGGESGIILARYDAVTETTLGTTISNRFGAKVMTIEHLMAAIWAMEIDNLYVDIKGPELPIMDGSSEPFIFLLECAGVLPQNQPRRMIQVIKEVVVGNDNKKIKISPSNSFNVSLFIDFDHNDVSEQYYKFDADCSSFKTELSRARTFCFEHEVEEMRRQGLAKGGSLDNAIVVGKNGILNRDGVRYRNEFVRHKVLDCIGDFYLAGCHVVASIEGHKSGHEINNKALRALFSDKDNWREVVIV